MEQKLTLKLDKGIVNRAKSYAKNHNSSVSQLVEEYFRFVTEKKANKSTTISASIKQISGILNDVKDIDYKKERLEYQLKKHSL
ncbi:MAG: DUF6364 family protein [Leptospirales bacterium]